MPDEEQDKQQARYEFQRALEDLEDVEGRGTELISVYVPPDKRISDVAQHLREEKGEAQNIKSKKTRDHVSDALESILSQLKGVDEIPDTGLVFFFGHQDTGGGRSEMVQKVLAPPEPIESYIYRCDSEFFLEPLEGLLADKETYGLIVIDRSEASFGFLRGKSVDVVANIQSMVPSKHGKGGQSQQRFERLIEEAAREYFKKVGQKIDDAFLDEDLEGVFVGGPGGTKDQFIEQANLHHEIEDNIVSTFDVGYTDPSGLRAMVDQAAEAIETLELNREKEIMSRFYEEIPKDEPLATYGEEEVRQALMMGAVETLLLSEALRKERVELVCEDGHESQVSVGDDDVPESCPECGADVEMTDREDLVDQLVEEAKQYGSDVEMISTDSEEGATLMNAFGGVAALLRFQTGA